MITGLQIKNYRGFGNDGGNLFGIKKINLFLGKNNTGKSNILRFLGFLGENRPLSSEKKLSILPGVTDYYDKDSNNQIEFRIDFEINSTKAKTLQPLEISNFYVTYRMVRIGTAPTDHSTRLDLIDSFVHTAKEEKVRQYAQEKLGILEGPFKDVLTNALGHIKPASLLTLPHIFFLDEFRKLLDNEDLKKDLNKIINYDHLHEENKEKKDALIGFISRILKEPVEIKIPRIEQEIELSMQGGRLLPLSSFGTGVHQIILLGMYLVTKEKAIFCIDEPELHLHPSYQKDFLKFISDHTDHQYFIATHSNNFLDFAVKEKEVFSVKLEDNRTVISKCMEIGEISEVLSDLGIRASEILQTNGIIWVEGPSDRIYIKRWLKLNSPKLEESYHFTFQYYGGRILSHYSVEDTSFQEFLNLLFVNRNSFIVMDSDIDKKSTEEDLGETKRRIIEECEKASIKYWVTAGREIENYLSDDILTKYSGNTISRKQHDKIGTYCDKYTSKKKVQFSREITDLMEEDEINSSNYDLAERLAELSKAIQKWNK